MRRIYKIWVEWDSEAEVWYVKKSHVPGLHAEAATQEELLEVLQELIPELMMANVFSRSKQAGTHVSVPIELISRRQELLAIGC